MHLCFYVGSISNKISISAFPFIFTIIFSAMYHLLAENSPQTNECIQILGGVGSVNKSTVQIICRKWEAQQS